MRWRCRQHILDCERLPKIMGILNVTPDSFSDGGSFDSPDVACARALDMLAEGAEIIDVGGESTRPGASPVDAETEKRRVLPVVEMLTRDRDLLVSVDTSKADVAASALERGASIVNDISALTADSAMASVVRDYRAGVVLMHKRGEPCTMQDHPVYENVVEEVISELKERLQFAQACGIDREQIVLDPGIGFGKTVSHNIMLLHALSQLMELGCPLMIGVSRKRFIGALAEAPAPGDRLPGSLSALACSFFGGARLFRVHDVAASVQAARIACAIHDPEMLPALAGGTLA